MDKPIKPKKPKALDPRPRIYIEFKKALVRDRDNKYHLLDEKTHPHFFQSDNRYLNWEELEKCHLDHDLEHCNYYSDYQAIYNELIAPISNDFNVGQVRNSDGYYSYSIVTYAAQDPDYQKKLKVHENRFKKYEEDLAKYEIELKKYNEFKIKQKKQKLEEELKKLK